MGALVMVGDVPRHVDWCVRRRGAVLLWISVCIYLLFQIDFMSMNCNFFRNVERLGNVCPVLVDDFNDFNTDTWNREVELGGFG